MRSALLQNNFRHACTATVAAALAVATSVTALAATPEVVGKTGGGATPAPWTTAALARQNIPPVYLSEWAKAENKVHCAPLILAGAESEAHISIRSANYSGGWAVAYDAPQMRSAFGIAGSGAEADADGRFSFPDNIVWSDGSNVSYGLEGGTGPGYLAYLQVKGQSCLYNIWSKRGKNHIEQLISSLRLIAPE